MNKVIKSYNYADYIIDFAMLGKSTSTGLVAIQFISNKPVPVLKDNIPQGAYHQISLDVGVELSHECTVYVGSEQLRQLHEAIGKAIAEGESTSQDA